MWSSVRKNLLMMPIDSEQKDFTQIEDNLFLGNIEFAQNHHSMQKYGISLVIAVYPKDLIGLSLQLIPSDCRFHHIDAKDSPNEDLISHFDVCFEMINEELQQNEGRVLIYCGAGLSRSVTIMAAYLMKKYKISSDEAVERIRALRRRINPNKGFVAQLKLYEDMSFQLDRTNPDYRIFALILLKKQIWSEKYWEDSRIAALNRQFCDPMRSYLSKVSLNEKNLSQTPKIHYKCLKCDQILFEEINVLSFLKNPDVVQDLNLKNRCDRIFIEPIKWLTPLLSSNKRGEVNCPKCESSLGSFKWKAFKCVCDLHIDLNDSRIIKIQNSSVIRCSLDECIAKSSIV